MTVAEQSAVAAMAEQLEERQTRRLITAFEHATRAAELARKAGQRDIAIELSHALEALQAFGQSLNSSQRMSGK